MSAGADGPAEVAVATVRITPDRLLPLFGFNDRIETCEGVRDELEANILSLRSGGSVVHIVSVDALYGGDLRAGLRRELALTDDELLVLASHSHGAPGVDAALDRLGPTDPEFVAAAVAAIAGAIRDSRWHAGGRARWSADRVENLFVNRRRPILGVGVPVPGIGRVVQAPHPSGPVDDAVRVCVIEVDDRPVAVLWGASCHPVCCPTPHRVSADFPGVVRVALRAALGDVPVLFAQGFSGDVRPWTERRMPPLDPVGVAKWVLAAGRRFVPQTEDAYSAWCARLAATTVALCEPMRGRSAAIEVRSRRVGLDVPARWSRAPIAHRVDLAPGCSLVGVNAEVMSSRVADLARIAGAEDSVLPAACCDEVLGYWPTDRMCTEGGYEAVGSRCFFPDLDWSAAGGPDAAWDELITLLGRAGGAR